MNFRMFERGHKAYRVYLYASPVVVILSFVMMLKSVQTSKISALLYLLLLIITIQAVAFLLIQTRKSAEVSLLFTEGYFVFTHPSYKVIFTPSAVDNVVTKKSGGFVELLIILNPSKIEVRGTDKTIYTLNVKMTNDEYNKNFRVFYEGIEPPAEDTIKEPEKKEKAPKVKKEKQSKKEKEPKEEKPKKKLFGKKQKENLVEE